MFKSWTFIKFVILLVMAVCTATITDFLIPGIFLFILMIAYSDWKAHFFEDNHRVMTELNDRPLPLVRITYIDGEVREVPFIEFDFKVGQDMKVYYKDPNHHSKWTHEADVERIEFFLHEFDPIIKPNK